MKIICISKVKGQMSSFYALSLNILLLCPNMGEALYWKSYFMLIGRI